MTDTQRAALDQASTTFLVALAQADTVRTAAWLGVEAAMVYYDATNDAAGARMIVKRLEFFERAAVQLGFDTPIHHEYPYPTA